MSHSCIVSVLQYVSFARSVIFTLCVVRTLCQFYIMCHSCVFVHCVSCVYSVPLDCLPTRFLISHATFQSVLVEFGMQDPSSSVITVAISEHNYYILSF